MKMKLKSLDVNTKLEIIHLYEVNSSSKEQKWLNFFNPVYNAEEQTQAN
jgi:hypothetical protein